MMTKERGRRLVTGMFAVAGVGGALMVGSLVADKEGWLTGDHPSSPPPSGFSRDTDFYKYRIIIDAGNIEKKSGGTEYMDLTLFTNDKPEITDLNGQTELQVTDVYCPTSYHDNDEGDLRKRLGCTGEFMSEYEIFSPKRIILADNQPLP